MFIPNMIIQHSVLLGYDSYGQQNYAVPVSVPAAIVSMEPSTERSSVRADSSGSRGAADELNIQAVILVPATISIKVDDKIEVDGMKLEVRGVQPRRSTQGRIDHLEIIASPQG